MQTFVLFVITILSIFILFPLLILGYENYEQEIRVKLDEVKTYVDVVLAVVDDPEMQGTFDRPWNFVVMILRSVFLLLYYFLLFVLYVLKLFRFIRNIPKNIKKIYVKIAKKFKNFQFYGIRSRKLKYENVQEISSKDVPEMHFRSSSLTVPISLPPKSPPPKTGDVPNVTGMEFKKGKMPEVQSYSDDEN